MTTGSTAKTVATLAALAAVLPLNLAVVSAALVYGGLRRLLGGRPDRVVAERPKTVMISGGKMSKALQLARSFHAAGHRVVLIESHKYWLTGHRFSRAVDRFLTVPEPGAPAYVDALVQIIEDERVDVYVPVCSPVASLFDAAATPILSRSCEVVHAGPDIIERLDDKYAFAMAAEALRLRVPKTFRITNPEQVAAFDFAAYPRPFILKSIAYDAVRRLDLTRLPCATPADTRAFAKSLPISDDNPWILQEFIAGAEYCTHGTLRDGELRVHCCCASSAFQINYEHVDDPEIEAWVRRFGSGLRLTGQASFDFIRADDDGELYAIECNPRTHSAITMFYNHPDVAAAYLGSIPLQEPIRPLASSRPTYWLYHEVFRLLTRLGSPAAALARLRTIVRGKDAVFDWRDPLPFLMLHHWQIPLLLLRDLREGRGWLRIDFNIGKLVQAGGD